MAALAGAKLKILILEDDTEKLSAVIREILRVEGIELDQITEARDAVKAKRLMQQINFDLLVLDVQIPLRIDQNASREVGLELLREITTRPGFKCPYHIIGITAYEDILDEVAPAFVEQLWTLLKYDPTSDGWARQLRNKVEYLNRSKRLLRHSDGLAYETDLAILTALDEVEFSAVQALPVTWTDAAVPHDGSHYIQATFSQDERQLSVVATTAARMGMSAAAVAAIKLIHNFRPRYLCMCGITAGVRGKVNLGDILVPSPSWDWGSGKIARKDGESRFMPDPYQISVDQDLCTRLREYVHKDEFLAGIRARWPARKPDHPLRLHVGPVASGAAVLADPNVVDSVKDQQRKLLGIEMEVYGVMTAGESCARPRPVTFALKSVCDFGDEQKSDDSQHYAAYTSATFLYQFALRELVSEKLAAS